MAGRKARSAVFAPEVPAIHVLLAAAKGNKTWMRGTSPRMTASQHHRNTPHAGQDHPDPRTRGQRFRLLSGDAGSERPGAGGGARERHTRRRQGSPRSRRRICRARIYRRSARFVLAHDPRPPHPRRQRTHHATRTATGGKNKNRRSRHGRYTGLVCRRCRNSTAAPP